ncbi:MAG: hypothetical protein ACREX9_15460 [Gammaproteobacteria bacterium]
MRSSGIQNSPAFCAASTPALASLPICNLRAELILADALDRGVVGVAPALSRRAGTDQ